MAFVRKLNENIIINKLREEQLYLACLLPDIKERFTEYFGSKVRILSDGKPTEL